MSNSETTPVVIDYYTDVLCVWAWIGERRVTELLDQWGGKIRLEPHCVNVFGDTRDKMTRQWADRGGFDGFAEHVQSAAADYDTAPVHPDLWRKVRPTTSATAHLVIKAAGVAISGEAAVGLEAAVRQAFFTDARDISQLDVVLDIATSAGLNPEDLSHALRSGEAMAALLSDYGSMETQGIKGSPSWVMNDGRQILYGNVGYRILHANVEELLRHPRQEASWC